MNYEKRMKVCNEKDIIQLMDKLRKKVLRANCLKGVNLLTGNIVYRVVINIDEFNKAEMQTIDKFELIKQINDYFFKDELRDQKINELLK